MKRLSSSDSLGALVSICPNSADEQNQGNNPIYTREFQAMLEGLDEEESAGQLVSEKKRRLSLDQVKALEKNFEVENKLEPERKVKLAQELGLQPRQVAVWFQNRRARWKTKQLEKDYGILKASYDGLKLNFEKLQHDNESLLKQIGELKAKLNEGGGNSGSKDVSVKEEGMVSDTEEKPNLGTPNNPLIGGSSEELNFGDLSGSMLLFTDHTKDGGGSSDDSDSSAILNEDTITMNNNSYIPRQFLKKGSSISCSSLGGTRLGDDGDEEDEEEGGHRSYFHQHQAQFVKVEEHNFFGEESCSTSLIFADDQAPTLPWYCSEWELKGIKETL